MSGTIIITFIILVCLAAAVSLMVCSVKKQACRKESKLARELVQVSRQENFAVSRKVQLRNQLIAIDATHYTLLHLWLNNDAVAYELISLDVVKRCELVKLHHPIAEKSTNTPGHSSVAAILLKFTTNEGAFTIPFYSGIDDDIYQIKELSALAEHWCHYINIVSSN